MGDYVQTGCLILGILCFFYYFTHCHVCRDHCGLCMDLGSGRHCISGDPGAAGFSGFLFGGNASLGGSSLRRLYGSRICSRYFDGEPYCPRDGGKNRSGGWTMSLSSAPRVRGKCAFARPPKAPGLCCRVCVGKPGYYSDLIGRKRERRRYFRGAVHAPVSDGKGNTGGPPCDGSAFCQYLGESEILIGTVGPCREKSRDSFE